MSITGVEMTKHANEITGEESAARVAVDTRVRVYPGTDAEDHGVVVEDFGEMPYSPVDVGGQHIADAARRWAVMLDRSSLCCGDGLGC
jgi:hypothetical protein